MRQLQLTVYTIAFAAAALGGCQDPRSASPQGKQAHKVQEQPRTAKQKSAAIDYEKALRSASEITVDERSMSVGKHYNILADGKKVATVTGKSTHALTGSFVGDVFTLKSLDGRVLASEKEEKRYLRYDRAATVYDGQGKVTGYIAEEQFEDLFSFGYIFHFYDANDREVGKSQKIGKSSLNHHSIMDRKGKTDYSVDKKFVVTPGDTYELQVKDRESEVPLEHAILLVCIEDAIGDASE